MRSSGQRSGWSARGGGASADVASTIVGTAVVAGLIGAFVGGVVDRAFPNGMAWTLLLLVAGTVFGVALALLSLHGERPSDD